VIPSKLSGTAPGCFDSDISDAVHSGCAADVNSLCNDIFTWVVEDVAEYHGRAKHGARLGTASEALKELRARTPTAIAVLSDPVRRFFCCVPDANPDGFARPSPCWRSWDEGADVLSHLESQQYVLLSFFFFFVFFLFFFWFLTNLSVL